ncbi:hypothetical protein [Helicobacter bizzozeronii]|uniref:Uncharacterized protein n=1 Tax=Helicobacter bizzozeronii (strain CIII-1) TaxID=1002804 RepID=F8KRG7_HELBC|nr:hypothetical protein [Helicobacter bizzozeronii]GMB93190.1 hypothetical protein NHP200010_09030 [Helicobacter bizzozeronii]CCB79350.1 hypothetical protein HBZC1_03640 [Helicobacter bizzozeronii CIII-1]
MDQSDSLVYESKYRKDILFQRLLKNFILTLVFTLVALIAIRIWLWPRMENYRTQHTESKQKQTIANYKQKSFLSTLQAYRDLKQKNIAILQDPSYQVVSSALNKLLNQYFSHITIQEQARRVDPIKHVIYDSLGVGVHAQSLKDFYAFLDHLVNLSYTKIELPVSITKQGSYFKMDFMIHIEYQVDRP